MYDSDNVNNLGQSISHPATRGNSFEDSLQETEHELEEIEARVTETKAKENGKCPISSTEPVFALPRKRRRRLIVSVEEDEEDDLDTLLGPPIQVYPSSPINKAPSAPMRK